MKYKNKSIQNKIYTLRNSAGMDIDRWLKEWDKVRIELKNLCRKPTYYVNNSRCSSGLRFREKKVIKNV